MNPERSGLVKVRNISLTLLFGLTSLAGDTANNTVYSNEVGTRATLSDGINYKQEIVDSPSTLRIHTIEIPDISRVGFLVTPPQTINGWETSAQTLVDQIGGVVDRFKVVVAVNANFFEPFESGIYPNYGDGINILGQAVSQGIEFSPPQEKYPVLCIGDILSVDESACPTETENVIAGNVLLINEGEIADFYDDNEKHPRTAMGISEDGKSLWIVVVDGRQKKSEGVTLTKLSEILLRYNVYQAINFDGGGSCTLIFVDENGNIKLLNIPVNKPSAYSPGRMGLTRNIGDSLMIGNSKE
ncbi:phosphodiester glycosidase family protein [Candidatus Woesebacteria bacterium]|nr:MAG: phosphodiester glycosidase family protein [Candidatus Woesebacteria bacterium]